MHERLFYLLLTASWLGCGSSQTTDSGESAPRIVSEMVGVCETMLMELTALDENTLDEAALQQAMESASANASMCAEVFLDNARTPAEQVIARNRARQFELLSRSYEAAMSVRFDNRAFYCEIVRESFQILLIDQVDVETALSSITSLTPLETRTLQQLRDLNLETLDVLFQATDRFCDFEQDEDPPQEP